MLAQPYKNRSPSCELHKENMFYPNGGVGEGATTIVLWENWPKKEGAYPKTDTDTETTKDYL
jgi:hypothetical protein